MVPCHLMSFSHVQNTPSPCVHSNPTVHVPVEMWARTYTFDDTLGNSAAAMTIIHLLEGCFLFLFEIIL